MPRSHNTSVALPADLYLQLQRELDKAHKAGERDLRMHALLLRLLAEALTARKEK